MTIATDIDTKVLNLFGRAAINKSLAQYSTQFRRLPRFVADYLIASLIDPDNPGPGIAKIERLMAEHFVDSTQKEYVKRRIRESDNRQYQLFGQARVRYDQGRDMYWADVPALDDASVRIDPSLLEEHGAALLTTGAWGTLTIAYDPTFTIARKQYPFLIVGFQPMQITSIDLDEFIDLREQFTTGEWIDLLITSIGFDPERIDHQAKLLYLARLIAFVEPNVNLVELGPPESGKTYHYRSTSTYSFVVSGSNTTVASLFYNKLRRQIGLVGYRDCVIFDEIAHADVREMAGVFSMLKDYMNEGWFGRDTNEQFSSECGIVFCGNIETDRQTRAPRGFHRHLFAPLPRVIGEDRAFLDRIHGYIPGWLAPQIRPENYATGYGLMADYLSEVMHRLRGRNHLHIISDQVDFHGMGQRNVTAVSRLASGFLKLVYPHRSSGTILPDELTWAVDLAVGLRQRVVDQLAIISPGEFAGTKLTYSLK
ncbi:MAG: hypothetical protein AMXMBFR13_42300 [Phycisphaerae bacterium]